MILLRKTRKICMLCTLCLVIVFSLTSCAKNEATKNFDIIAADIKQLQTDISAEVVDSTTLLTETSVKDLADPNLLNQLQSEIDLVKNFSVVIPEVASNTDEIKQQIENLTTTKGELQKQLDSIKNIVSTIATSKEEKLKEAITPKDSYSIIHTDGNGLKVKITLKMGKWIKGSDAALVDKAWKIVGGKGSMPVTGSYNSSMLVGGNFDSEAAAYAFGTVTIENMTPEFSIKGFSQGQNKVYLGLSRSDNMNLGLVVFGLETSSGSSTEESNDGQPLINADMTSNTWGPVPIAIGVESVFTPNYPDGNPQLSDTYFSLTTPATDPFKENDEGRAKFKIEKTW